MNDIFLKNAGGVQLTIETCQPENPFQDPFDRLVIRVFDNLHIVTHYCTIEPDRGASKFDIFFEDKRQNADVS